MTRKRNAAAKGDLPSNTWAANKIFGGGWFERLATEGQDEVVTFWALEDYEPQSDLGLCAYPA